VDIVNPPSEIKSWKAETINQYIMAPTAEDVASSLTLAAVQDSQDTYLEPNTKDLEEIGETEKVKELSIKRKKEWLRDHTSIRNCRQDDSFLLRFARMQKHQVPLSCTVLENYLLMRKQHPQWFQRLDIRDEKLAELVNSGYLFALPEKDPAGRRIIFSRARSLDPTRHSNSDAMRAHILTFEALLEEEDVQLKGFTYIFDCAGVSLAHLSIWSPSDVRKLFTICEKNLPMRHKDINLVCLPFPIRFAFEFAKNLLSDKIRSRFSVHSSIDSIQVKFGEQSSSLLPLEYGGTVPLQEMTRAWAATLEERRDILLDLDKIHITENKIAIKTKPEKSSLWRYLPSFVQSTESV